MSERSLKLKLTADESDCFSGWRHYISSMRRAGIKKNIRNRFWRRHRRLIAAQLRDALKDQEIMEA